MKKRYLYFTSILLFILAASFVVIRYNRKERDAAAMFYPLKERKAVAYQSAEWATVKKRFDDLMKEAGTNPDDIKPRIGLAALFIQEARITGNYVYYDMAAMKYINTVLAKDSANFTALIYKSLIYLSQHHFADGTGYSRESPEK